MASISPSVGFKPYSTLILFTASFIANFSIILLEGCQRMEALPVVVRRFMPSPFTGPAREPALDTSGHLLLF
jgi:hypothetical protein